MARIVAGGVLAAATAALLLTTAVPAGADVPPTPGCTTCTATFDTVGPEFTWDVPANITSLKVTVAGAAGFDAANPIAVTLGGVGGLGGVGTVDLGTSFAGETMVFGVGGIGEGSYVQSGLNVLMVAGGGGQGGYMGRLDLPDQIFSAFPGGDGAAPVTPGTNVGSDAAALAPNTANGQGGQFASGGAGGTGSVANGLPGENFSVSDPNGTDLADGGAGAAAVIGELPAAAGAGGGGISGGGGGGITSVPAEPTDNTLAAPGGGGSGYLDISLVSGTEEAGNTGTGYVTFVYTVPALPATGGSVPPWLPIGALALLLVGAVIMVRQSRSTSA